jgi:hypothetical protein
MTVPDPLSKCSEKFDLLGCWQRGEHGVHTSERLEEVAPMFPTALPFLVIRLHDPSVDVSPLSSEKTREASLLLNRKTRHELCWSGKDAEKECKKFSSEMWNVFEVAEFRLKVRDAVSAIVFLVPAMETDTRGEASLAWMRMARARVRRPATLDWEELSLLVQLTVGVLSHHAATWTWRSATTCSRTRKCNSMPAISSKIQVCDCSRWILEGDNVGLDVGWPFNTPDNWGKLKCS